MPFFSGNLITTVLSNNIPYEWEQNSQLSLSGFIVQGASEFTNQYIHGFIIELLSVDLLD